MKKNINEESTKTALSTEKKLKTRRKALKSILAASGVVAGSQALSSEWTRPLVESVVLPAHAQTSLSLSFSSGIIAFNLYSNQPWYAKSNLLDTLISPAQAIDQMGHRGVRQSVCGISGGDDSAGTMGGSYQILFNITGSDIDICFSSLGASSSGSQVCTKQKGTSINGKNIADTNILMDSPTDPVDRQEIVELSSIVYDEASNTIKGKLNIEPGLSNADDFACGGDFTCTLTTTAYACNTGCT